jgi:hypothetical protein
MARALAQSMHKYKIGQAVDLRPGRWSLPASTREYKILRLLPVESGERMYRVKSEAETFERSAKESELSARTSLF